MKEFNWYFLGIFVFVFIIVDVVMPALFPMILPNLVRFIAVMGVSLLLTKWIYDKLVKATRR